MVIRYVPTYVEASGLRTLMRANQGHHTFETPALAQAWLDAVTANTSADTLAQVWGPAPQFAVCRCACYDSHWDAEGIYFDPEDIVTAQGVR